MVKVEAMLDSAAFADVSFFIGPDNEVAGCESECGHWFCNACGYVLCKAHPKYDPATATASRGDI